MLLGRKQVFWPSSGRASEITHFRGAGESKVELILRYGTQAALPSDRLVFKE